MNHICKRFFPETCGQESSLDMLQEERRKYLIEYLLKENSRYEKYAIPENQEEQRALLRALMNVRMPGRISEDFLAVQDEYLRTEIQSKGITTVDELIPVKPGLFIWQGDITRLAADAIVNAANSGMTGCYVANHTCIDNCIHTFAGIQLRYECAKIMELQGHEEETGAAKITPAYNLPSKYVLHTVGPVINDKVSKEDEELLASCYRSCLKLAWEHGCKSIAFCCISTGVFHFPNRRAAEIAIETVDRYKKENHCQLKVVFNVWKEKDKRIYEELLG